MNSLLLCLIFAAPIWTSPITKIPQNHGLRIIGGNAAQPGQFPWEVAIYTTTSDDSSFFCGGALIDQKWVLTSGHCVHNAVQFKLILGATSLAGGDPNKVTLFATFSILHPNYQPESAQNDVGLIRIDDAFILNDYVNIISLSTEEIGGGVAVTVSGWGATNTEGGLSYNLNFLNFTTLSSNECHIYQDGDDALCASGTRLQGICTGDGGNPLIVKNGEGKNVHVGIAQWGSASNCDTAHPSTYTRTSYYKDWILKIIHN